jgi:hypothetical protein
VPEEYHNAYLELWRMHRTVKTGIGLHRGTDIEAALIEPGNPATAPSVVTWRGGLPLRIAFVESH